MRQNRLFKLMAGLCGGSLLTTVLVIALLGIGWVMNIVKLCKCDFEPSYKAEAIRVVGVFVPPVGAITGWFDLGV